MKEVPDMGEVIQFTRGGQVIDLDKVLASHEEDKRQLREGMILPAEAPVEELAIKEHAAEPIKRVEDIERISEYLISKERYRDNMLFIVGINLGLRLSDLQRLTFAHLIDEDFRFKKSFPILEKKTSNTRKVKKNRYVTINEAVIDAVTLYLRHNQKRLNDYLFVSESNNGKNFGTPLTRKAVENILDGIKKDLSLDIRFSSHSLRKTFGYHQMLMSGNDPRKLLLLQKIFGHSTSMQTLDYIGITSEEIEDAYLHLNLGSKKMYQNFSTITEAV